MNKQIGFGLVGAGAISAVHAEAIARIEGACLVGVFDTVPEAAKAFATKHRAAAYQSYQAMLMNPDLDAVIVCTPSGIREAYVLSAAQTGKHVICEKPIEIKLDRIDRMIQSCQEHGVLLMGIFNNRFNPVFRCVKRAVDEGAFGKMLLGDVYVKWYRSPEYYKGSGWRGTWKYDGGGALMNQSIHFIDLLQWIMGPVAEVRSFAGALNHQIKVEDTAVACVRFESGALGVIEGSTVCAPGLGDRLELSGEKGSVKIENGRIVLWNLSGETLPEEELGRINPLQKSGSANPLDIGFLLHQRQLEQFVRCLQHGDALDVDGREARKAVELILRIYESAGVLPK